MQRQEKNITKSQHDKKHLYDDDMFQCKQSQTDITYNEETTIKDINHG